MMADVAPVSEAVLLQTLNQIIDPCSIHSGAPAGLVEMGLVRDVVIAASAEGGAIVSCKIGVTEMGCMMAAPFADEARERLRAVPGISRVQVEVDQNIHWGPEQMSSEYRVRLESVRQVRRVALGMPGRPAPLSQVGE